VEETHDCEEHLTRVVAIDVHVVLIRNGALASKDGGDKGRNLFLVVHPHLEARRGGLVSRVGLLEHEGAVVEDEPHFLFVDLLLLLGIEAV
jgi:hypothetical protein